MKSGRTALIVIVANWHAFIELAEMIRYSLVNKMGFDRVDIVDDKDITLPVARYTLNFVIKSFRPFNSGLLNGHRLIFQTEECWNDRENGMYRGDLHSGYDRTLEMYDENLKLRNTGTVVYCPVGYSPVWERDLPRVDEDIDIFFHGSLTPRRRDFLSSLAQEGYIVREASAVWGEERDKIIMRSKIVINVKASDRWSFGPLHCLPAQANKKFIMAEKANGGYGPFIPNRHFIEYNDLSDCKDKVKHWLDLGREKRDEFALSAYNDMVKTCDFTDILKRALESNKGGKSFL